VPSAFVAMAAFPLTPNGKVDRKALPEPAGADSPASVAMVAPRNDVEVKVAEIFTRLLGKASLSIHESFFDAGGHSLLAVRVTREVNAAFGMDLSVGAMFEDPTVAALAARIAAGGGKLGSAVLPLQAGSEQQPIYFICGIQLYQQLARLIGDTHASYGLFVPAEDEFMQASTALTDLSITRLASAYVEAIDKHRPAGPVALVGVSFGGLLAFEVARQLAALGREVGSLTLLDTVLPAAMQRNWSAWVAYRVRQLQKKGVAAALDSLKAKLTPKAPIVISPDESRDNHLWRLLNSPLVDRYFARTPSYAGPTLIVRAEVRDEYDATFDVEPALGWSRYLTGPVRVASSPGDHLGILQRPETAALVHAHVTEHVRVEVPRASVPPPRPSNTPPRASASARPPAASSAAG
jgi:thioesterase domain-containing protein